jgi:hypothetical protein
MSRCFPSLLLMTYSYVLSHNYEQVTTGLYCSFVVMTTRILLGYHFLGGTYYLHLQDIKRIHVLLPTTGYTIITLHRVIIRKYTAGSYAPKKTNTSFGFYPACYFFCFTPTFRHPFLPHH